MRPACLQAGETPEKELSRALPTSPAPRRAASRAPLARDRGRVRAGLVAVAAQCQRLAETGARRRAPARPRGTRARSLARGGGGRGPAGYPGSTSDLPPSLTSRLESLRLLDPRLTGREFESLRLLMDGLSVREIAETLVVAHRYGAVLQRLSTAEVPGAASPQLLPLGRRFLDELEGL
jgi:hypothetical protein